MADSAKRTGFRGAFGLIRRIATVAQELSRAGEWDTGTEAKRDRATELTQIT